MPGTQPKVEIILKLIRNASVGGKQSRKENFWLNFSHDTVQGHACFTIENVYVCRLCDRSCGVTVTCRVVDYFEMLCDFFSLYVEEN